MSLYDELLNFIGIHESRLTEQQVQNLITVIQGVQDSAVLDLLPGFVPQNLMIVPTVKFAIESQKQKLSGKSGNPLFDGMANSLFKGFMDLKGPMQAAAADIVNGGVSGSVEGFNEIFSTVTDMLLEEIIKAACAGTTEMTLEFKDKMKTTLQPLISLGLTFTAGTIMAEVIHPMKEMGFGNISHLLVETVGFQNLMASFTGPLSDAMIAYPTRHNIHKLAQPYDPDGRAAQMLLRKRQITEEDYADILRGDGLQEVYVQAFRRAAYRDLTMMNLQRFYDVKRPDPAWVDSKVKLMGYSDEDIPVMIDLLNARAIQREIGDIRTVQRSQYKRGVLSRDDYTRALQGRGFQVSEVSDMLDAVDDERRYEDREDLIKLYEQKFLTGRMDSDSLRVVYQEAGKNPAYIEERLALLDEQRIAKLEAAGRDLLLTRADHVSAYRFGLINREQLIKNLDDMGYSTADAVYIADLEDARIIDAITPGEIPGTRGLSRSDILTAYKAGRITGDQAVAMLTGIGYSEDDALFIVVNNPPKSGGG